MSEKKVLWDAVIPDQLTIPGRKCPCGNGREGDLILKRVPGVDYALYVVELPRDRLFSNKH